MCKVATHAHLFDVREESAEFIIFSPESHDVRMTLHGLLRLSRPVNAIAAGMATTLGYLVGGGLLSPELLVPIAVVSLVTAAGNAVNDLFDASIDALNRPDRPIPSGQVTLREAAHFSVLLFAFGVLLAYLVNPLCFAIASFNSLLLVLYAARLKRLPLLGNLVVSYLSASIFLFGGAVAGIHGMLANAGLALVTLSAMMSRELVKTVEDLEGDRTCGANTFAVAFGVGPTLQLAFSCICIAVLFSLLPIMPGWGIPYLVAISIADAWMLLSLSVAMRCSEPACVRGSGASLKLKAGMFAAVAILVAASMFA